MSRLVRLLVALLILNGAVTFANVWPTLGVHWRGELSVEVAALLVLLSVRPAGWGPPRARTLALLGALGVIWALGRYADVTAPALYGRPVNLYWDVPHVGEVIGMLTRVARAPVILAVCAGALLTLVLLYAMLRWALGEVTRSLQRWPLARVALGVGGALLVGCFLAQQLAPGVPRIPRFSIPVAQTYGVQAARVLAVISGRATRSLPPSPPLRSALSALGGDDVLLIFVESYGRSTYDRAAFRRFLQPVRAQLLQSLQSRGLQVVSAFVTSPTFGGTSVLAHLSLLTGIQIDDTQRYRLLMTQQRPTLVSTFRQRGYRTVAFMPGNQHPWPEGSFYGFDHIYDADQLRYRGPAFGWWHIPDQFSFAALNADELARRPRRPLFVFFPTLSTHMPFRPIPPLQPDWSRLLGARPYAGTAIAAALARTPRWTHLGESYAAAVQYFFASFASWLRSDPDEHAVIVLIGDHQPAASVSGPGAPWDVPVHVISARPLILQSLERAGFRPGLTPADRPLGPMSALTGWLLAAFDGQPPDVPAP